MGKAYTLGQAARLAGTSEATVRRWLRGYDAPGHQMAPVFGVPEAAHARTARVSFLELTEIIVAAAFRRGSGGHSPVTLEKIRRARDYAQDQLGLPYPFASLELREEGGHLLHEYDLQDRGGGIMALDLEGQWRLPLEVSETYAQKIEFAEGNPADPYAIRLFPRGRDVPIVIDPHRAGGQPSVLGRGVTVETLLARRNEGEDVQDLADDYDLDIDLVKAVLQAAA